MLIAASVRPLVSALTAPTRLHPTAAIECPLWVESGHSAASPDAGVAPLLLLLSNPSLACTWSPPDPADAARGVVLIGYVTGEEYPDYEADLIRDGKAQYPLTGRHIVRVTFTEALKGRLIGPMELATSCYESSPKAGDRAMVIWMDGGWVVVAVTAEYENAVRAALKAAPKKN